MSFWIIEFIIVTVHILLLCLFIVVAVIVVLIGVIALINPWYRCITAAYGMHFKMTRTTHQNKLTDYQKQFPLFAAMFHFSKPRYIAYVSMLLTENWCTPWFSNINCAQETKLQPINDWNFRIRCEILTRRTRRTAFH